MFFNIFVHTFSGHPYRCHIVYRNSDHRPICISVSPHFSLSWNGVKKKIEQYDKNCKCFSIFLCTLSPDTHIVVISFTGTVTIDLCYGAGGVCRSRGSCADETRAVHSFCADKEDCCFDSRFGVPSSPVWRHTYPWPRIHGRLHELHASKFPFVSRIEFIRSKLSNFSAHVSGVHVTSNSTYFPSTHFTVHNSRALIQQHLFHEHPFARTAAPNGYRGRHGENRYIMQMRAVVNRIKPQQNSSKNKRYSPVISNSHNPIIHINQYSPTLHIIYNHSPIHSSDSSVSHRLRLVTNNPLVFLL